MLTLQKLRGDSMLRVPTLGRTLTLYRQGGRLALSSFLATVVLFNLPWRLPCDVSTREGMREAVAQFASDAGRLDIMVNNAAWVR